jgi:hypothetical protein
MNRVETYLSGAWSFPSIHTPIVSLNDGVFTAFLSVDISGDSLEVPVCIIPVLRQAKQKGCTKIVFPLVNGTNYSQLRVTACSTSSTIFRTFWDASINGSRIAHVITSKGVSYYGGRSIILDSSHDLLMLTTLKATFIEGNAIEFSDPIYYLSYKVFENSNELVEKNLIKIGIPMCSRGIFYPSRVGIDYPKVVVTNLDNFIVKPQRPNMANSTVEQFNKTIIDNYVAR